MLSFSATVCRYYRLPFYRCLFTVAIITVADFTVYHLQNTLKAIRRIFRTTTAAA